MIPLKQLFCFCFLLLFLFAFGFFSGGGGGYSMWWGSGPVGGILQNLLVGLLCLTLSFLKGQDLIVSLTKTVS